MKIRGYSREGDTIISGQPPPGLCSAQWSGGPGTPACHHGPLSPHPLHSHLQSRSQQDPHHNLGGLCAERAPQHPMLRPSPHRQVVGQRNPSIDTLPTPSALSGTDKAAVSTLLHLSCAYPDSTLANQPRHLNALVPEWQGTSEPQPNIALGTMWCQDSNKS